MGNKSNKKYRSKRNISCTYKERGRNIRNKTLNKRISEQKVVESPTKLINLLPVPVDSEEKFTLLNQGTGANKVNIQNTTSPPLSRCVFNDSQNTGTHDGCKENISPTNITNNAQHTGAIDTECKLLTGRRIVDLQAFLSKLKDIADHKSLFNCGFASVNLISEFQQGLYCRLNLQCSLCNLKFVIETTDRTINKEAVGAIMATGGGYVQLEQFTSAMDLNGIKEKKYIKLQDEIAEEWDKTAWNEMKKAGEIERNIALKEGRVNKDGIAMIDVIVDGCWSRRSYQTNYAANSGCATIIGRSTGKVLFMAVKNKYCCICQRNGKNIKDHKCFKNYDGPSTAMEATILAEGFKKSIEMHNIIYQRFIADGDSNTYAKIMETRPYNNVTVEKLNCRNHILRRFCSNMQKLTTDTRYLMKDRKLITKSRILSARKYIRDAIKTNKVTQNYENLHNDINNSVCHAFGKHNKCNRELCSQNDDKPTEFNTPSLWQRIGMLAANVASYSRSLIEDVDSNPVEQFNSVVAKLVGGKRVNYAQRRGYQTRCAGAVISFNTKKLLSTVFRNTYHKSPKKCITNYEQKINLKRQRSRNTERKRKQHIAVIKHVDLNYGENAEEPDMDPQTLKQAKKTFLANLRKTEEERQRVTKQTVLQSLSSEWLELRRNLLTASNFGKVVKRKKTLSCRNIVKNMLYSTPIDHVSSIQHGRQYEAIALAQLSNLHNIQIRKCGLYIDENHNFLGATPDGITDDMVVEVKCPIAPYKLGCIGTAIKEKKLHFWKHDKNDQVIINKRSDWYYQIQGQMHICQKPLCLFAVWYGENKLKVEIVQKDDEFWRTEMEPKLVAFYMDCLLPELVDPRHPKKKAIRDPAYVTGPKNQIVSAPVPGPENLTVPAAVSGPTNKRVPAAVTGLTNQIIPAADVLVMTNTNTRNTVPVMEDTPPIKRRKLDFSEF